MLTRYIFTKKEFDSWDLITIILYTIITIVVNYWDLVFQNPEFAKDFILIYSFTPIILYLFNYKSLRNVYSFLYWLVVSIYHFKLYNDLILSDVLLFKVGHAANGIHYTLCYLIFFMLLRSFSLYFLKKELVAPVYMGGRYDIHDNRKISMWDWSLFAIYITLWFYFML